MATVFYHSLAICELNASELVELTSYPSTCRTHSHPHARTPPTHARRIEKTCGPWADATLCVTDAMNRDLAENWGIV